jgi:hypothetical protein
MSSPGRRKSSNIGGNITYYLPYERALVCFVSLICFTYIGRFLYPYMYPSCVAANIHSVDSVLLLLRRYHSRKTNHQQQIGRFLLIYNTPQSEVDKPVYLEHGLASLVSFVREKEAQHRCVCRFYFFLSGIGTLLG